MRAPAMDTYLTWIVDAWKSLPTELILKSFKGCALTTLLNGEEDHLLHCFKPNGEVPDGLEELKKTREERAMDELENLVEEVDLAQDEYGDEDSDESLISN